MRRIGPLAALALAACSSQPGEQEQVREPQEPVPTAAAPALGAATPTSAPLGEASAYTAIDLDACALVAEVEEGASATWRCPGYGGHPLIVMTGDGRMDVDAGADNGAFETLSPFNDIGRTVEWRLDGGGKPFAVIYRLRTATPDVKPRSVLFVETIGRAGAPGCLLARIEGSVADANNRARQEADRAARGAGCARTEPVVLGETT